MAAAVPYTQLFFPLLALGTVMAKVTMEMGRCLGGNFIHGILLPDHLASQDGQNNSDLTLFGFSFAG